AHDTVRYPDVSELDEHLSGCDRPVISVRNCVPFPVRGPSGAQTLVGIRQAGTTATRSCPERQQDENRSWGQVAGSSRRLGSTRATRRRKPQNPRSKRVDLGGARSSVTTREHTGSAETGL